MKEEPFLSNPTEGGVENRWQKMNALNKIIQQPAVPYYFGRKLLQNLDYPIGIIVAAHEGTAIE